MKIPSARRSICISRLGCWRKLQTGIRGSRFSTCLVRRIWTPYGKYFFALESNYADTPALKSVLANSLWLDGEETYNDTTLQRLAEQYYASTFRGTPGSKEMDQALQTWTDNNTGGLLKEYTKDMAIAPDTVFELVSTIYYKAMWRENFWEVNTEKETFHGTAGDTDVDMMKKRNGWMSTRENNLRQSVLAFRTAALCISCFRMKMQM